MKKSKKMISLAAALAMLMTLSACSPTSAVTADTASAAESASSLAESSLSESYLKESSKKESSKKESSQQESSKKEASPAESSAAPQESSQTESSKAESSKAESSQAQSSAAQEKPPIENIILSDHELTLYVDGTYRLHFTIEPYNADQSGMVWRWSDDSILTVVSDGTITAHKVGEATITIRSANGITDECKVTVRERPPQPTHDEAPEVSGAAVSAKWFDDVVFVGDSVTNCLNIFSEGLDIGNAEFLCSVGLGYHSALWDLNASGNVHPVLYGEKTTVDEGVKKLGRKKVIMMFGMNDFAYGIDDTIEAMKTLTDRILAKSPDVQFYVESVTPLISSIHRGDDLNNENIAVFNERLKEVCLERSFVYIDVASAVSDDNGCLIDDYCLDPDYMGLHLSQTGCQKWIEYLKKHVEK